MCDVKTARFRFHCNLLTQGNPKTIKNLCESLVNPFVFIWCH